METLVSKEELAKFSSFIPFQMAHAILSIISPLFIIEYLNGSIVDVGLLVTLTNLSILSSSIMWGHLIDAIKQVRVFLLISTLFSSIIIAFIAMSKDLIYFFVFSMLHAVFLGAFNSSTSIFAIEHQDPHKWEENIGWCELMLGIGWASGLLAGSLLVRYYDFRYLIWITAFLCLLAFILSVAFVREDKEKLTVRRTRLAITERVLHRRHASHLREFIKGMKRLFKLNTVIFELAVMLFSMASTLGWTVLPVFFSSRLKFSASVIFMLYFIHSIVSCGLSVISGKLAEKYTDDKLLEVASSLRIPLFSSLILCMTLFEGPWIIVSVAAIMVMTGLSWAFFIIPSRTLSLKVAPEELRGESSGIFIASSTIGVIAGGILGGLITASYDYEITFLVSSLVFLASHILFVIMRQPS